MELSPTRAVPLAPCAVRPLDMSASLAIPELPGTDNAKASTSCSPCPPGTIPTATSCNQCEEGKYGVFGATVCTPCSGDGQYADEPGLPSYKFAPSGYKPTSNNDGIVACAKNTFSLGGNSVCSPCQDGGHSQPGSATCEQCLTSKYFDEPNERCDLCPKNTFTTSGATNITGCTLCSPGGHSKPGSGYCEQCLTGKYFDEPNNECKLCPKNTFSTSGATTPEDCTPCPSGSHSQPGAGFCEQCLASEYIDELNNKCELCPAGKFSPHGASTLEDCNDCSDGFYSTTGAGYCTPCSAGQYGNQFCASCHSCTAGKYSGLASYLSCDNCDEGKYSNQTNAIECESCTAGYTSAAKNAECECKPTFASTIDPITNQRGCTCEPGYFLDNGICIQCQNGFFKTTYGTGVCKSCDKYAVKGAIQTSLPASTNHSCLCSIGDIRLDEPPPTTSTFRNTNNLQSYWSVFGRRGLLPSRFKHHVPQHRAWLLAMLSILLRRGKMLQ